MLNKAKDIFYKLTSRFKFAWKLHVTQSPQTKELHRYQIEHGMLRFVESYPLDQDCVVFDVGGYTGEWAMRIWHKYQCKMEIFEPMSSYSKILTQRFRGADNVVINKYGLGAKSLRAQLSVAGDASSLYSGVGTESLECEIRAISDVLDEKKYARIDLIAINIEGAEYDLIEELIKKQMHLKFKNILIQFHDSAPNFQHRMNEIRNALIQTHIQTFCYEMVWENWRLR